MTYRRPPAGVGQEETGDEVAVIAEEWTALQQLIVAQVDDDVRRMEGYPELVARAVEQLEREWLGSGAVGSLTPGLQLHLVVEAIKSVKQAAEQLARISRLSPSGGEKFTDATRQRYRFCPYGQFVDDLNLEESRDDLERLAAEVAKCSRQLCTGEYAERYSYWTLFFNTVSAWPDKRDVMLITSRGRDKSTLTPGEIVFVQRRERSDGGSKDWAQRYEFSYSNLGDRSEVLPSTETPLNYEIHDRLKDKCPGVQVVVHPHPTNILDVAWSVPFLYRDEVQPDLLWMPEGRTPSVGSGRDIPLADLAQHITAAMQEDPAPYAVFASQHGCWIAAGDFEEAFKRMGRLEEQAGRMQKKGIAAELIKRLRSDLESLVATGP